MRPIGVVAQAILTAARQLATADRAPTLAELAAASGVGRDVARCTVSNLKRSGDLTIVRERRVKHRNRPVSEYAPACEIQENPGWVNLGSCLSTWAR